MRLTRALPVLAAVAVLSGCGVAPTQFHPGVAARVGDQTISTKRVDQLTSDYCAYAEKNASDSSTGVPLHYLSHQVAAALVLRAGAQELAATYDVSPTSAYTQQVAQATDAVSASATTAERDALITLQSATAYTRDVLTTIGDKALQAKGTTGSSAQDQLNEGLGLVDAYLQDHDTEINPKYSIDLAAITDTSKADPAIGESSVAVSSLAKAGQATEPDATYVGSLPANLVCGG